MTGNHWVLIHFKVVMEDLEAYILDMGVKDRNHQKQVRSPALYAGKDRTTPPDEPRSVYSPAK